MLCPTYWQSLSPVVVVLEQSFICTVLCISVYSSERREIDYTTWSLKQFQVRKLKWSIVCWALPLHRSSTRDHYRRKKRRELHGYILTTDGCNFNTSPYSIPFRNTLLKWLKWINNNEMHPPNWLAWSHGVGMFHASIIPMGRIIHGINIFRRRLPTGAAPLSVGARCQCQQPSHGTVQRDGTDRRRHIYKYI